MSDIKCFISETFSLAIENVAILCGAKQKKSTTAGVMLLHVLNCI